MPDLREQVVQYLNSLRRANASPHTIRNYGIDLDEFVSYLTPPDSNPPLAREIDVLSIREWLASLYERNLSVISIRRKLAAVRSFFNALQRSGALDRNVARLIRTPKAPKTIPAVMTPEQTNNLIDQAPGKAEELGRSFVSRDVAILEFLYGCGIRVTELTGLNTEDADLPERWLRVSGKGKKQRQVPYGASAGEALNRYLADRKPAPGERALFLNSRGTRLTDRSVRNIVKIYSRWILGDPSTHPHSFRHAYATHMLAEGADLRSIQELLGHASLSTTQKYTQLSLAELMAVYDRTHPKA